MRTRKLHTPLVFTPRRGYRACGRGMQDLLPTQKRGSNHWRGVKSSWLAQKINFYLMRSCSSNVCALKPCSHCAITCDNSFQKQPPRQFSKISVLFFQEHLFLDFSRRLYVFTEQILIFQEGLFVRRTDHNFPEEVFSARRTDNNFPGRYNCSPNRYHFFQESMSAHRTDNDFPGAIFFGYQQIPIIQEHYFFGYRTETNFPGAFFDYRTDEPSLKVQEVTSRSSDVYHNAQTPLIVRH